MRQLTLIDIVPEDMPKPEYPRCFKWCRHFDTHPDYQPDYFPGTKEKRCTYDLCGYGTSGKQFYTKLINNIWHMWCKNFEWKGGSQWQ